MIHKSWLNIRTALLALVLLLGLPVQAALTVNSDGTVTDSATGLVWDQCSWGRSGAACASGTSSAHNWQQALGMALSANNANYKNHTDWRLPNINELESLVDLFHVNPAINPTAFPNTEGLNGPYWRGYWSSTPRWSDGSVGTAWDISFDQGSTFVIDMSDVSFVRLVRGGPLFGSFDALAPSNPFNVVAVLGNASAIVSFTHAGDNGAVVSGYTVRAYAVGAGAMRSTSAAAIAPVPTDINAGSLSLNHTITGLINGTTYTFTVIAHGSEGDSAESVPSAPLVPSVDAGFSLIDHYYTNILNREPDAGGKAFWQTEVVRMSNLGVSTTEAYIAMASKFYTSPEFLGRGLSDEQYLQNLYLTFLNRPAEPTGLDSWKSLIGAGLPRDMVMYGFMFSTEFNSFMVQNVGSTSQRPEVGAVFDYYRGILGRLPEDAGIKYWVNQFRSAQCSDKPSANVYAAATSIAAAFFGSPEYISDAPTPRDYVADLYNAFMRRIAEPGGYNYWVDQITRGLQGKDQARLAFIESPEFAGRVQAIAAASCVGMMQ